MSVRSLAVWFAGLGLTASLVACGGGATTDNGGFFPDGGHHDGASGQTHDATSLGKHDAPTKLMGSDAAVGCKPKTCADQGFKCGAQGDGCGNVLQCGSCTAPETCGGGGVPNTCGAPSLDAGNTDGGIPTGPLSIAPLNQTIHVTLGQAPPTLTFTAKAGTQSVAASFSIDLGQIATINPSSGVLTPSGTVGGVAHVTATFGTQTVSTPVTVAVSFVQSGAPAAPDGGVDAGSGTGGSNGGVGGSPAGGPVSASTQTLLQGPTTAAAGLAFLYPYDKTVWPQAILPPLLQWSAPLNYDSVYIHLQETAFDYKGFFSAPVSGQPFINVPIQKTAWDTLLYSNQGENVTATLVFSAGGVAYGPLTETWVVAQGTLTGAVYYNSYGTSLAINYTNGGGLPNFGGATLAIKQGATSPVLVAGANGGTAQCRVCHSVAAGGSTLITEHGDNYNESSSYALTASNTETVMPPGATASVATYGFAAISPDGTFLFSNAGKLPGTNPPATSGLFDVATGAAIASTGLPAGLGAATPVFSPDGTHVAFNNYGTGGDKVSLASIDYVQATNTFSNLLKLNTPASGTKDLFPAFMPTNDSVVFEREVSPSSPVEFGGTRDGARGELWWVDLATQTAAPLANLNGVGYLPTGASNHATDETLDYEPTINPVPSGGYAWVVFTSRRLYGNVATQDPFLSDPRNYNASLSATTKKLWVAAIDLNAPAGTDPSHPAFYLPAQEILAGNSRGYWVVDPCESAGTSCATGDQCCSGYCGPGEGGVVCGTPPAGCAVLGQACAASGDCCGASTGIACIDGYCEEPAVHHDAGGCVPTTCSKLGFNCGPAGDSCGGLLECGTCTSPDTCGGAGKSGVCGAPSGPP
jgi:hypothetical protein